MLEHRYGDRIRVLADPFLSTLLARVGSPDTGTEQVPALVRSAYRLLGHRLLADVVPSVSARIATRMAATEPRGFYQGPAFDRDTRLVICAVIRAGILPSQAIYETALEVLPPENVRLDFLNMSRTTDEDGHVTGVRLDGSKIGGDVDGAIVLFPDPMGATGGTVARALEVYRNVDGTPAAMVAAHLMVTPEAITRVLAADDEALLYSGRIDRGLSTPRALAEPPGTFPDEERGLNDVHYIVPGAGGMGELMTNSWV